ncbi:MAG: carboxypeptidase regulatory-like domain-containing protein [Acidobacteria bacterium]|nr:carboxypeptidase regulatory-like domain-containing protein [Acidobacteriota bacterium]
MLFFSRFLILAALTVLSALAQSEVGGATVNGTVFDPSGATVPKAKLTALNTNTGLARSIESSDAGVYNFVRLPVGQYSITVEKSGFKLYKKSGIELTVGAVLTLDVRLEVGAVTETANVTADIPVVETSRVSTATTVNEKAVRDLPINGRNFLDFTVLTPGVVRDQTRGGDLSFGGQRGTSNSVLVDGGDSNNLFFGQSSGRAGGGRNPYTFSQDAVQEFQVNTSGFAPEIGRSGGGVINMVTKSGTNDFHGTAFWFFRDRSMNANSPINKSRGIARPPYHFNQFGGNLGGPIKKDKLFFFFNYDGQRNTNPNPVFFPIAPSQMRIHNALSPSSPPSRLPTSPARTTKSTPAGSITTSASPSSSTSATTSTVSAAPTLRTPAANPPSSTPVIPTSPLITSPSPTTASSAPPPSGIPA